MPGEPLPQNPLRDETPPENRKLLDAMERRTPPKAAPGGWREAIEAAAKVCDRRREHCAKAADNPTHSEDQQEIWAELANENLDNARAIRALASPPPEEQRPKAAPGGWREIASAPKDGTGILATDAKVQDFHQVTFWDGSGWGVPDTGLLYHPEFFTHWMPLPPPPRPEDKGRADIAAEVSAWDQIADAGMSWGQAADHFEQQSRDRLEQALAASRAEVERLTGKVEAAERAMQRMIVVGEAADREITASRARADALAGALEKALSELEHAAVFVGSRERIHPTGMALYGEVVKECRAALAAHAAHEVR